MYQSGLDSVHSNNQLNSQAMLSRSNSRLQSSIQKIDSHMRSNLPFLQGKGNKKYIFFKYHKFFEENKIEGFQELLNLLMEQFEDKIEFKPFKETNEILKDNYNGNELYYLIVPKFHLEWAEIFAKQERNENSNKIKIYVYGILKKQDYEDKIKARSKKRVDIIPDYIDYFYFDEPDYPQKMVFAIQQHLDVRLRQENQHIKAWALTNRNTGKKIKKRTLHFFYQQKMEQEFTGIYKTYKKKNKSSWLQIYSFRTFEDVLKKIREREVNQAKEIDVARRATSKLMSEMSINEPVSMKSMMKSGIMDAMGSQLNSSVIASSIKAINKLDKNDLNVIICNGSHNQIEKLKALVSAQKYNNWYLWEIDQKSSDVMSRLKDFLNEEARNNEILENEEYERIINCPNLIIMAHINDDTTINMFHNHRNIFNQMTLETYSDPEQFSLKLRTAISSENFIIAVVPGGFRSFATEYSKVINEFIAAYRSGDGVENFKFISSAVGRHGSNLFPSSNLLGAQSNLTDVRGRYDEDLQKIMEERDKRFHPIERLTGANVHLLIQQSIEHMLDGLKTHIEGNPRLKKRTYMDKQWLKQALETLTIRDDALIITNDYTLREAQHVASYFPKVQILNITDRVIDQKQKNVMAEGNMEHIYNLIKEIPAERSVIEEDNYNQYTQETSYTRSNRLFPKKMKFYPGNLFNLRLPASLKDEESHKMQNRLQKYFSGNITIEYYNHAGQIRLINKDEEPISFIVWAYYQNDPVDKKTSNERQLSFMKQLAVNEAEELRLQFLVYSDQPDKFRYLVQDNTHTRFRFLSNRWQEIQKYIIGCFTQDIQDKIFHDQKIIVFYDENDPASREALDCVTSRKNGERKNAANYITFHPIEDLITTLEEESPYFKYYVLFNQDKSKISLQDLQRTVRQQQYADYYVRVIVINQGSSKKIDRNNQFVKNRVRSYWQGAQWLCRILVEMAPYYFLVPHVIIDNNSQSYYYFLDKYSALTTKFTYSYIQKKDQVKKIVNEKPASEMAPVWIIVKQIRSMYDYVKMLEKLENYKKGYVRFIYEGNQNVHQNLRGRVVFQSAKKKEVQKFLQNIYRRDKHTYFPSSLGNIGSVMLAIMPNSFGNNIPINKHEIMRWQNILKAKVYYPKNLPQLSQIIYNYPSCMFYVVSQLAMRQQLQNLFGGAENVRRILMANKDYDFRYLDTPKVIEDSREIFVGTYPAEITDYLRYLRYNIRKPEATLQKLIENELIELYIQQEYKLSEIEVNALTSKNDSLIIKNNGYKLSALPELLKKTNNSPYLHVFIGDDQSGRQVFDFNSKNKRDVKFIDVKTSDLVISKGQPRNRHSLLQTNDARELITYLFNLPENRYKRAINHRGKYHMYINSTALNLRPYSEQLQKIQKRNSNITVHVYNNLGQEVTRNNYETSHVLLHSEDQRLSNQTLDRRDIYYFIVSEIQKKDKNYNSTGNKQFVARKGVEFKHFMNQIPSSSNDYDAEPIIINVDQATALLNNIQQFGSAPLPLHLSSASFYPPFRPLPQQDEVNDRVQVDLFPGTLDSNPPSFAALTQLANDALPQPLGLDVLIKIKKQVIKPIDGNILQSGIDSSPLRNFQSIRNESDDFSRVYRSILVPPRPEPVLKQKLAILYPNNFQFSQIGEMLRRNLEPEPFSMVILNPFRNEIDLQQYSKNNGQKLNGYDKIVVFLPNSYRRHDSILKTMKGKLGGRMQYFIFDDNFHLDNHQKLKIHLRPYKIKKYELPYVSQNLPKFWNKCGHILILVPQQLQKKYEGLKSSYVDVQPYYTEADTHRHLHSENTFIILVVTRQTYHNYKWHAKTSPFCTLLVDTDNELPEDELYLYRIWMYSIFYGQNGEDYLRRILPSRPVPPFHEKNKYLFYGQKEEELVFVSDYEEYMKVFFKDWQELYHYLLTVFKGRSNWLIKQSPGKPEIVPLNPVCYLENKDYMKAFKNNFIEQGYLSEEVVSRKSKLVMHQFSDLPEVFYNDDRDLARLLEKQEAPSVVLFDSSLLRRISGIRNKFNKHKYIGLIDHSERWIDQNGILMEVIDDRLRRKQDVFINMFNKDVFDAWNDMRYFYLSNRATHDQGRNVYFRTKQGLLQVYNTQPNLLMIVFVQAQDINHIPQAIMAEANSPEGRVKLILVAVDFVDEQTNLYIKFNEIDPVIKHINDVESAGRIDFMVYHQGEGERTVQTLIQKRRLKNLDDRVYQTMEQVQDIALEIKGKYKKVYVICFEDERQEIENIFNKYSIRNKGIPDEGVEFHYIDRKSFIIPNASRLQPSSISNQLPANNGINRRMTANDNLPVSANSRIGLNNGNNEVEINVHVRRKSNNGDPQMEDYVTHREVITITHGEPEVEEEEEYGLPSMDSNIKPANKLENILSNKNYVLCIDQKLKGLFPVGKFFANKATYFTNPNNIPQTENGASQLIVSTQVNPNLVNLSEDPEKYVIMVGKPPNQRNIGNVMVMKQDEIPGLIKKLEGSSMEDELNNIKNIDDFSKVRVVYDKDLEPQSKRKLLAASDKNPKIFPVVYKNVNELKTFLKEPDSLMMLMMKDIPAGLVDAVEKQNKTIVKRKKVRMIVPKKSESDVDGLETILEEEEVEQEGDNIKYLSDQQVQVYLKLFETYSDKRPKINKPEDWQGERYNEREEIEAADMDNITRLNVHSNIDPGNLVHQNQIEKIKQRLTGDLIVLVVDNSKRGQVDEAIKRYNVLVQGYTNSMNLQNDIRDRKDNVTIAVIDRNMLDKIPIIKKKYPQTSFILESDNPHDEGIEQYRPYLSGHIRKIADLDKIIGDLYQENERIRFNAESNRAASRFQMKRTSIVDLSNNQRFSVGLSNQKSKKAFLFYKQPENNHIRNKLGQNFANLNFIPYKSIPDFKRLIDTYNNYTSILIANGNDIPDLEEIVSKKKELVYVIRFNPPTELRDNPKVKKLLSTYNKDDLERFIMDEFQKYSLALPYDDISKKYKLTKNVQVKQYQQKYEPNTFGTTPRFSRDFVPPKSKESTYSRRYMKSSTKSKLGSRLDTLSPKGQRNQEYYQG